MKNENCTSATVVCYGMGVDSTALLCLLKKLGQKPDYIVFADTGGEKPETYHFKEIISKWIVEVGFPELVTVRSQRTRGGQVVNTLEEHCLAGQKLPSIAYGKKACSIDWKRSPTEKYFKDQNVNPHFLISYNADETRRAVPKEDASHPLIEHGIDRLGCLKLIIEEGLPVPTKSACFFCPSSNKNEVKALARKHPDLAERAIAIEKSAQVRVKHGSSTIGLGRHWRWEDVITSDRDQLNFLPSDSSLYCDCIEQGVSIEQYWRQFD